MQSGHKGASPVTEKPQPRQFAVTIAVRSWWLSADNLSALPPRAVRVPNNDVLRIAGGPIFQSGDNLDRLTRALFQPWLQF